MSQSPSQVDLDNARALAREWRTIAEATAGATVQAIQAGILSPTTLARLRKALDEYPVSLFDTKESTP